GGRPAAPGCGPGGRVGGGGGAGRRPALARANAARRNLGNIEFRTGDMERLEFPDASFDAVVCVFAIFFVADMAKQVRALWRLVLPGGRLALTTRGPRMAEPGSARWGAGGTPGAPPP